VSGRTGSRSSPTHPLTHSPTALRTEARSSSSASYVPLNKLQKPIKRVKGFNGRLNRDT
jgi:hypothetical protein